MKTNKQTTLFTPTDHNKDKRQSNASIDTQPKQSYMLALQNMHRETQPRLQQLNITLQYPSRNILSSIAIDVINTFNSAAPSSVSSSSYNHHMAILIAF